MEIPEKLVEVLKHEGVAAIVTQGVNGPYAVNTWNSYIKLTAPGELLIPAGGMQVTEENIGKNRGVLVTLGSREVNGFRSLGTGFLITGKADFCYEGEEYNQMKERFPWMRAVLVVRPESITQTL